MRRKLMIVIAVLGLVVAACGGGGGATETTAAAGGAPTQGDPAKGQELFAGSCASCHGADAKGIEGLGKNLVDSEFVAGLSDPDLVAFVKKGRPSSDPANTTGIDMPPKGGNPSLSDQDLFDIVAYIRTLR